MSEFECITCGDHSLRLTPAIPAYVAGGWRATCRNGHPVIPRADREIVVTDSAASWIDAPQETRG